MIAFARGEGSVTLGVRLPIKLGGDWASTTMDLPAGVWKNQLTGETFSGGSAKVSTLLARFPVALLSLESDEKT